MNFDKLIQDFNSLMGEYQALTKEPNMEKYDSFGWKCLDFVGDILDIKEYTKEQITTLKSKLIELKKLVPNLVALKEFISQYFKDTGIQQNTVEKPKTLGLEASSS